MKGKAKGEGLKAIRALTKKGYSQKKIALKLHIRKTKVVAAQRALGIGRREKGGAVGFWKDVASVKRMKEISQKEATKEVKFSKLWYERRQKRLTGVEKARDTMRKEWYDVKSGKINLNEMLAKIESDEDGLMSEAGYE